MTEIQEHLLELKDEKYGDFQANLTPGMDRDAIIGVRVPLLRAYAKELQKAEHEELRKAFLTELPHKYYDENMLHAALIPYIKDYEEGIAAIEAFLPYVDNWAVCDTMKPKYQAKKREAFLRKSIDWAKSDETYTCRFGIEMLMNYYLDDQFSEELLGIVAGATSEEYYVKMMVAWYFATALAKQWDATIPYIEERRLPKWNHNKTIQKAVESYRITDEQKEYLRTLRWK